MWAKSLLLSAMFAANAVHAPASVSPHVPSAHALLVPIQDNGRHRDRDRGDNGDNRVQDIRPLRDAVEEVRSQAGGGELLNARLEQGARPFYVIRWRMPDGQVRDFRVSAVR